MVCTEGASIGDVMIAQGELPTSSELPAPSLIQIIDKTRFAISTEETRYYLNGIFLHVTDDGDPMLKAAATDGHRLARVTLPRPAGAEGMPDVIVPRVDRTLTTRHVLAMDRTAQAARRKRQQCDPD